LVPERKLSPETRVDIIIQVVAMIRNLASSTATWLNAEVKGEHSFGTEIRRLTQAKPRFIVFQLALATLDTIHDVMCYCLSHYFRGPRKARGRRGIPRLLSPKFRVRDTVIFSIIVSEAQYK
jgi:hypothetical protein